MSAPRPHKIQPTLALNLHHRQGLALLSQAQEVLYGGAAGGGKSHLMRAAAIIWCMMIPGLQVYLFRRTVKDLIKNHFEGPTSFPALLAPLVRSRFVKIVKNEIRFCNGPNGFADGSRIFLNHCEHEADVDNYRGYEFHVLLMDELTLFSERQYRMLQSRVRMSEDFKKKIPEFDQDGNPLRALFPRILCGSNPGGVGHHFVRKHWVDHGPMVIHATPPEDCEAGGVLKDLFAGEPLEVRTRQYIPAKLADNPTLDRRQYAATLVGLNDPLMIRAMLDGDWKIVSGAMFGDIWRDHLHVCPAFDIPIDWSIWRGADDGFAAAHCTLWGTEDRDAGTIYVCGEVYGTKLLPDEIARRVKDKDHYILRTDGEKTFHNNTSLSGIMDLAAWADTGVGVIRSTPTQKISRGDQMNALGMNWKRCRKWPGCEEHGWQNIYRLLAPNPRCPDGMPGLRVFDNCVNLIRTLPAMLRDLKEPEKVAKGQDDHAPDALRYLLQWKDGGFELRRVN